MVKSRKLDKHWKNVPIGLYSDTANAYVHSSAPSPPFPPPSLPHPRSVSRDSDTSSRAPEHFIFSLCDTTPHKLPDGFLSLTSHFEDKSDCSSLMQGFFCEPFHFICRRLNIYLFFNFLFFYVFLSYKPFQWETQNFRTAKERLKHEETHEQKKMLSLLVLEFQQFFAFFPLRGEGGRRATFDFLMLARFFLPIINIL